MARGPASFFRGTLRLPGAICGRSSSRCAAEGTLHDTTHPSSAISSAARERILCKIFLCKILESAGWLEASFAVFDCALLRDVPMNIHDKAPDFTLQDENGKDLSLKDLKGKVVILFFYPRADTPG